MASDKIRVCHRRHDLRLLFQSAHEDGVVCQFWVEDLYGDLAVQRILPGEIDRPHASCANDGLQCASGDEVCRQMCRQWGEGLPVAMREQFACRGVFAYALISGEREPVRGVAGYLRRLE